MSPVDVALGFLGVVSYLFFGYFMARKSINVTKANRTLIPEWQRTDFEIWINWRMMLLVPITTFSRIDRYSEIVPCMGSLPKGKPIHEHGAPLVLLATNHEFYRKLYIFWMTLLWPTKIVWTVSMVALGALIIFPLNKFLPEPRSNGGAYD